MTALYAICDQNWNLTEAVKSPKGIKAVTGKQFGDATQWTIEELRANFVLVIDQGVIPDQEWQTTIGNPTVVIDGDPEAPETMTATLQYTTQPITLEAAKAKLKERAKHCKFARMDAGVEFELGGTTYIAQTDSESRSLLMAVYFNALSGGLPNGRNWRFRDNSYPHLTSAEIIALGEAVNAMVAACFDQQAAHDAAIDALADLDACKDYDCSFGYPVPPG
ncbi:DUF4376 domain-containing protein [Thalassospira xiamenensis]|uniref:DUF4376 domain-containing protein n=1 Tax=Thalassospira xiamenensis TaxID=220697 RepID=A0A367XHR7_9PROT|nr:DUF4376 domain-containing protein [Thalassospira xiamenensis]KZB51138.1 hypothetical protein AUP41_08515 [Thalassospira xiamenensis]RCK53213.1 hypothetical protein TH44_03210 [Thalassospira xiamenensis]